MLRFASHDARDFRTVRGHADRRGTRLLPRSRPGGLHPLRPQLRNARAIARADRFSARDPRPRAAVRLHRSGGRARREAATSAMGGIPDGRSVRPALPYRSRQRDRGGTGQCRSDGARTFGHGHNRRLPPAARRAAGRRARCDRRSRAGERADAGCSARPRDPRRIRARRCRRLHQAHAGSRTDDYRHAQGNAHRHRERRRARGRSRAFSRARRCTGGHDRALTVHGVGSRQSGDPVVDRHRRRDSWPDRVRRAVAHRRYRHGSALGLDPRAIGTGDRRRVRPRAQLLGEDGRHAGHRRTPAVAGRTRQTKPKARRSTSNSTAGKGRWTCSSILRGGRRSICGRFRFSRWSTSISAISIRPRRCGSNLRPTIS